MPQQIRGHFGASLDPMEIDVKDRGLVLRDSHFGESISRPFPPSEFDTPAMHLCLA